ncbi:MAG: glutaminyl-peptide cyclotransferase [Bacteroidales bacterium]|nr:glutaminyl-peptide cyclotransferase [Bacteroidales bacterium]
MRNHCKNLLIFFPALLLIIWVISCSGRPGTKKVNTTTEIVSEKDTSLVINMIRFKIPAENSECTLNHNIKVALELEGRQLPDSITIWYDSKHAGVITGEPWTYEIPAHLVSKTGRKAIKASVWRKGKLHQTIIRFVIVLSDIVPKRCGYVVINSYPHDSEAFTQGLVYHKGYLYEGTGQENKSSLRKTNLKTGEIISQHNLESRFFGEGIAILNNKIYQLTWQTKVGFVYDLETMQQINKFYYPTEGWGLTTMDNKLVMSDGSNILYIIDPEMFLTISQIEVCDNKGIVTNLNELEYINGEIWANIWETDLIARIDPESGKVLAYIDLKGIMDVPGFDISVNVLNGIAFDRDNGRIFVTGKNWPKLFEIQVKE